jgi:hypothetical protein
MERTAPFARQIEGREITFSVQSLGSLYDALEILHVILCELTFTIYTEPQISLILVRREILNTHVACARSTYFVTVKSSAKHCDLFYSHSYFYCNLVALREAQPARVR